MRRGEGARGRARRVWVWALFAVAALGIAAAPRAQACSTALLLAVDVSSSVDAREFQLQIDGMAAAFREPVVIETIVNSGGIMVGVFFWSGAPHQETRAVWTPLRTPAEITAFADEIARIRRRYDHWATAMGEAMRYAETAWVDVTEGCARRVLDISGDGVNNVGRPIAEPRARLLAKGVTINGLVILGADPDPEPFYRDEVIGGPGAFVQVAESFEDFPRAFKRKLLRELSPFLSELRLE